MKLYNELADWWPLLSPHAEYEEEAGIYLDIIRRHHPGVKRAVEFGSGGGSNAFYMKQHFSMTLTDLSGAMLKVSRQLNPECEHLQGDMRTIEAGTGFDLVFIHDAITIFTEEDDLRQILKNARRHMAEDGLLLIMTDQFKETFQPVTSHGGTDQGGRSLRYLEWTYDADPADRMTETEYVYLLKDADGTISRAYDSMKSGLFSMRDWERLLTDSGFRVIFEPVTYSTEEGRYYAMVARRNGAESSR